jgi:hypothetical protein
MSSIEEGMRILAASIRRPVIARSASKIDRLISLSEEKLGLTLIPVVLDESGSSLLSWGRNDDPTPGTVEQLVSQVYRLSNDFKHKTLAVGIMNELKTNRLYVSINYVQRTLFISRI